jgi:hypothetical protein
LSFSGVAIFTIFAIFAKSSTISAILLSLSSASNRVILNSTFAHVPDFAELLHLDCLLVASPQTLAARTSWQ